MATLMGVVVKKGTIEATYKVTVLGEESVKVKKDKWSDDVMQQAKAIIKLCDDLTPEIDDVIGVQLYTPITDPDNDGKSIDLLFVDHSYHRVNKPPVEIVELTDKFEADVIAEL